MALLVVRPINRKKSPLLVALPAALAISRKKSPPLVAACGAGDK